MYSVTALMKGVLHVVPGTCKLAIL